MYPISSAARALFDEEQRQCIRITGIDRNGASISITDADVIEGSFTIDRYVCNSDRLEIGTAVAAELNFKLNNADGRFSSLIFEGTELFVEIGIADWASSSPSVTWMPCGYFTPDEQPRSLSVITVSALDRMMRFENYMIPDGRWTNEGNVVVTDENGNEFIFQTPLTLPNTVSGIVSKICELCGVPLGDSISTYPNASLAVTSLPEEVENITFRTFIQWAAGVMGTNAFIDWSGNLRFAWYATTDYISTVAERYQSDLQENDITVTGIRYAASETDIHVAGTDEYALDITGNGFVNTNVDAVLADIWSSRGGFTYRPFTASVVNAPYLFPMDAVAFTDKDGVSHASMLTNVNFGVNGATAIAAKGQSKLNASYPTQSPFTFRQEQSLENIKRLTTDEITAAVENATEHITGASDSHVRFIYDNNGGLQEIVVMNTDDIDTATKVWRWNSGGLGYSNTGYEGTYGLALTQDGAIVADRITTGTLNAGLIKAGVLSDYAGLNTWNMATGEISLHGYATQTDLTVSAGQVISHIETEYGAVDDTGANLLLDTNTVPDSNNAPKQVDAEYPIQLVPARNVDHSTIINLGWSDMLNSAISGTVPNAAIRYGASFYMRQATNGYASYVIFYNGSHGVVLTPGETYTISCYARNFGAGETNKLRFGLQGNNTMFSSYQNVTSTSWNRLTWTFTAPTDSSYYIGGDASNGITVLFGTERDTSLTQVMLLVCGMKLELGSSATDWNAGGGVMPRARLASTIMQTGDAIRLQATTLTWEANNSSLNADGVLRMGSARITNSLSGVTSGDGLLLGRSQMVYMDNGDVLLSISMPESKVASLPISGYIDSSGTAHIGQVDPIVEEINDVSISLSDAGYLDEAANIYTGGYALSIGVDSTPAIKISQDGNICLNGAIYVIFGDEAFEGYTGEVLTAGGTLNFMNGILIEVR